MTANVTSKAGKPIREYDGSDPLHESQREKFSFLIAVKGMKQIDAFLQAYPTAKKWPKDDQHTRASQIRADDKVATRIRYLLDLHYRQGIATRDEGLFIASRMMRATVGDFDDVATNPATRKHPGLKKWKRETLMTEAGPIERQEIEVHNPLDAVKVLFEAQGYNAPSKHQIAAVVGHADWEQILEVLDARDEERAKAQPQIPAG